MPRLREITPSEKGVELAEAMGAFHAQLIKKGISKELAEKLALQACGGGSSTFDGHCGDLVARPGEIISNPVR